MESKKEQAQPQVQEINESTIKKAIKKSIRHKRVKLNKKPTALKLSSLSENAKYDEVITASGNGRKRGAFGVMNSAQKARRKKAQQKQKQSRKKNRLCH